MATARLARWRRRGVLKRWGDSGITPMRHAQGESDAAAFFSRNSCSSAEGTRARRAVESLIAARYQDSPSDSAYTAAELMAACHKVSKRENFCECAVPTVRRYGTPAEVHAFMTDFGKSLHYINAYLLWRIKEPINRCYER